MPSKKLFPLKTFLGCFSLDGGCKFIAWISIIICCFQIYISTTIDQYHVDQWNQFFDGPIFRITENRFKMRYFDGFFVFIGLPVMIMFLIGIKKKILNFIFPAVVFLYSGGIFVILRSSMVNCGVSVMEHFISLMIPLVFFVYGSLISHSFYSEVKEESKYFVTLQSETEMA